MITGLSKNLKYMQLKRNSYKETILVGQSKSQIIYNCDMYGVKYMQYKQI